MLSNPSSDDPHGQHIWDNQNDSPHPASQPMLSAQTRPLSEPAASHPEVPSSGASDLNDTPRSEIKQDEVPNPWMQELAYRPGTRGIPLPQQPGEVDIQWSQQHGQDNGRAQIQDSSHQTPEKERACTVDYPSTYDPSMGVPVEDGRYSGCPGQRRSNNPFLNTRQNTGGLPESSISGPGYFNFPQSTSLDARQNGNFYAHVHYPHKLDGELPQISSQIPFQDTSSDLRPKSGPRETQNDSPFPDKGKERVVWGSSSIAIHPSNPYRQSDEMGFVTQNLNPGQQELSQFGSSSHSSAFPNLKSFQEETKPSEIVQTDDVLPYPGKSGRSSPSKPDELDSFGPNSTAPSVSPERFQPSLERLNGSCQPQPARVVQEKLAETYDIRQVNWTDGKTSLRKSPMLVQCENGPCPLVALVNGLVLRNMTDSPSPIAKALQSREKISLGLIMQALFDELTSYIDGADQLPDIEALSSFLVMLHTGMNVNPQLVLANYTSDSPGTFLETNDTTLYSSFKIPLVHGWLAEQSSAACTALTRVAQNHDDIQLLHFRKEELEDRVFRGESLTTDDEKLMQDIHTIQQFVNVENATQLSAFGLVHLKKCLKPGSVSILFRNDHFSTLFKHPASNELFTLVTDAGYANHAEIVWESLIDVNGSNAGFFSGDFQPVGNSQSPASHHPSVRAPGPSNGSTHGHNPDGSNVESTNNTEQTDADYAFALALQFQDEEEQRLPNPHNQTQIGTSHPPSLARPSLQSQGVIHAFSSSGSNFSRRQSTSSANCRTTRRIQEVRPLLPRPRTPVADPSADAPPPTYEQAANSPVYTPSSDHSQYDGTHSSNPSIVGPRSSSYAFNNNLSPNQGSSYNENRRTHAPSTPSLPPRHRDRDRNKDCIVM
ncbi:hypothetical protein ACJ72_04300 [Emergomyces africanus]|uniref:MINDY deubiquitinase domain-containing protein n=1 Tax=Emergomyces africanus TaxID=1955775 RepID=A0A1B7NX56_9EURO|nr:hypothetical protein ACJ72_04300 [Emergomyces africanus]